MGLLGPKLGCVLVQLPPSYRYNRETLDRTAQFEDILPASVFPFAIEFRYEFWIQP
ncbi:MAG: DUF72 domain-containing protein [Gemmatimonadota bacterium]|nr:DUF72 domain-containing protein [Gemmatimonadota bacterium]